MTVTTDSSFKFSQRSHSTANTSLTDDDSMGFHGRKARGKSPGYASEPDRGFTPSRSPSPDKLSTDEDEDAYLNMTHDSDLSMRLELARQNSQSQSQTGLPRSVKRRPPPAFEDAFPRSWPDAAQAIAATGCTRIVPGHGDPVGPDFVRTQAAELAEIAQLHQDVRTGQRTEAEAVHRSPYPEDVTRTALARPDTT